MYHILNTSTEESLLQRLLNVRRIAGSQEDFLQPSFGQHWIDPDKLRDIEKALERIDLAIQRNEKIMIFGDYDVDGVTSSYLVYTFMRKFLGYDQISIMFPHRLSDGYGLKTHHLDTIKSKGVSLVITVDNGITSIAEARHAKEIGLDLIITDHHKNLPELPDAIAVINPQVSPDYHFKGICGAGVAFKLVRALTRKYIADPEIKKTIMRYFLPVVAIATVADCVPLIDENRLFVKIGLDYLNSKQGVPESLVNFVEYLNITDPVDSFHIGFMIGPRINAGGRIMSPYESLNILLQTGAKQLEALERIDTINTERKKLQESAYKKAEQQLNHDDHILIAIGDDFHEGIVGIVSGRITEKYYKPSVVLSLKEEEGIAVGSLRGPEYFNVIDMLYEMRDLLDRFGGHKQAGGLTIQQHRLPELKQRLTAYAAQHVLPQHLERVTLIDTHLLEHERHPETLSIIQRLAPFGLGNTEPLFSLPNVIITDLQKIGSRGVGHLKFTLQYGSQVISALYRSKGDRIDEWQIGSTVTIYGLIKPDTYRGGYFVDVKGIE